MKRGIVILLFVIFAVEVFAQHDTITIRPFVNDLPTKIATDQYLYIGTDWGRYGHLHTANNNFNTIKDTLGFTSFEIGLQWDFQALVFIREEDIEDDMNLSFLRWFNGGRDFLMLGIKVGYVFVKYSTLQDRWNDAGIHSHWLSFDASVYIYRVLRLGIRGDVYLGSTTKSPDGWSYNGFNSDCFNHITINPTLGIRLRYTNFFLDIGVNLDMNNKINHRKMGYYNEVRSIMLPTTDITFNIRLGIRNFTTAKKTR